MTILETQRLILREFEHTDAEDFFANNRDSGVKKFMPYNYHADINAARGVLQGFISCYASKKLPYFLAIVKKDAGILIGHIGIGEMHNGIEMEFAISHAFRGNGYATEAIKAFFALCKKTFSTDKIYALVDIDNHASCAALEKAGFTYLKTDYKGEFNKRGQVRKIYII